MNSLPVKNSREKLIQLQDQGYEVKLNDSIIRINNLILDEEMINRIRIDKRTRSVNIQREKRDLVLMPLSWVVKKSEKDNLLVIDGIPILHEKLDSLQIESSAFRSVQVLKDVSRFCNRTYKKVVIINSKTTNR